MTFFNKFKVPILFGIILGVAISLRIVRLDFTGYWIDEMSSVHFAGHSYWGALLWDNSPPTYHFLLKIWIFLFGTTESATRSLSVLISALTSGVWMYFGYRRLGVRGGVIAGFSHAVFALAIGFARETRMYALFELSSTVFLINIFYFDGTREKFRQTSLAGFFMAITHYLSGMPLVLWSLITLMYDHQRKFVLWFLLAASALTGLFVAIVRLDSLQWQVTKYFIERESRMPFGLVLEILGGYIGAIGFIGIFIVLFLSNKKLALKAGSFFVLPLLVGWICSWVFERSVFMPRYFIYMVPITILIILLCYQNLSNHSKTIKAIFVSMFGLFILGQGMEAVYKVGKVNPPWNEAARFLSNKGNIEVYTTRPLSLRSPYFDESKITFHKIAQKNSEALHTIYDDSRAGKSVWIIENYWGFEGIKKFILETATVNRCQLLDYVYKNESPDPVILINVICPK